MTGRVDVAAAARELIAGLRYEPWGQVSASVYETGRLVSLAPWLTGHQSRIRFLVATQHPDGTWGLDGYGGTPDGYGLVPTLSATEALLGTVVRGGSTDAVATVDRALRAVFTWSRERADRPVPDTPAVELIVPALITAINQHLADLNSRWAGGRLPLPAGMDTDLLAAVRYLVGSGADIPQKLWHALEVAGPAAGGARGVRPAPPGTVGASPAATAAWLGAAAPPQPGHPSRAHLEAVVARHGGPVPCGIPVTEFERAWVLSTLARADIDVPVPPELLAGLADSIGDVGTPGGAGLPPDADTTSVTLLALNQLGVKCEPDSLWRYENATHFSTWPGERGFSTSVNAHVLEAFGAHIASGGPDDPAPYAAAVGRLATLLRDCQRDDGSWLDRWHASPYYATACCALALDQYGGAGATPAVRRAVDWVLDTQRTDGSWGRWGPTAEETAYALHILLLTGPGADDRTARAAAHGYAYLRRSLDRTEDPPLWHDKDLYLPAAIVRAAVLAALRLAQRTPDVMALAR